MFRHCNDKSKKLLSQLIYECIGKMKMSGLMMMAKIAGVKFAEKPDGWDTLVFEVEQHDSRLNKTVSVAQTALIPSDMKAHIKQFRENEGQLAIVPVSMKSGKSAYLLVTGGLIDPTELLTQG